MALFKKKKQNSTRKKDKTSCSAVIAAAGHSNRMDGDDKLFLELNSIPVLAHTMLIFQNCTVINEIVVVVRDSEMERVRDLCAEYKISKAARIMAGGETRLQSVMNGVFAVSKKAELIAIHDGARPCVPANLIERTVSAAYKYHAAAPAIPISSTIKMVENDKVIKTIDRDKLFAVQTPQIFTADIIKAALTNAHDKAIDITDDCMAVELLDIPVHITAGTRNNIKLTTREDILIAQAIMGAGGDAG